MATYTATALALTQTTSSTTPDLVQLTRLRTWDDALEVVNLDATDVLWVHPTATTTAGVVAAGTNCVPVPAGGSYVFPYSSSIGVVGDGTQYTVSTARAGWS